MVELFILKNYIGPSLLISITSFEKMSASRSDSSSIFDITSLIHMTSSQCS